MVSSQDSVCTTYLKTDLIRVDEWERERSETCSFPFMLPLLDQSFYSKKGYMLN